MISVVVIAHNASEFIGETVESIAAQTVGRQGLEIVVVDSGSTDGTRLAAERAAGDCGLFPRFVQTTNQGPSHARNLGTRESTGEWIQFLDADDLLHPAKIRHQVDATASARETDASVYSPWTRLHRRSDQWIAQQPPERPAIPDEDPVLALLQAENFVQVGAQLFRRRWLDAVGGFDEQIWLVEDVDLMLRLALAGATFARAEFNVPLFWYRQRNDSLSHRDKRAFVEACMRNASMVEAAWQREHLLTPDRRRLLADVYRNGSQHYALRDRRRFAEIVVHIEKLVPGYVPDNPPRLRQVSRLLGYGRAETLAVIWRRLRHA